MSLSSPTGLMNSVGAYDDDVAAAALASKQVLVGDLLVAANYADNPTAGDVGFFAVPVSDVPRNSTFSTVAAAAKAAFLGVSKTYRSATQTTQGLPGDTITAAIKGRFKFNIPDGVAYSIGTPVGFAPDAVDGSGNYGALTDTVTFDETNDIGYIAVPTTADDTTCIVNLKSTICP